MRPDNKTAVSDDRGADRQFFVRVMGYLIPLIKSLDGSPMRSAGNRPIAVFKLALQAGDGDGTEIPAVARVVTIVSHDEAIIFGNGDGTKIGGWLFLGGENAIFGAVVVFI